jgi:hypothetical protein
MGWKNLIASHYQINNISTFSIKVYRGSEYDEVVTKISPFEYQIDTYFKGTDILTDSHIESNIKEYIKL